MAQSTASAREAVSRNGHGVPEASSRDGAVDVQTAFSLGWQMAELYCEAAKLSLPGDGAAVSHTTLPGLSKLTLSQSLDLRVDQLTVALGALRDAVSVGGLAVPDLKALRQGLRSKEPDKRRAEVLDAHVVLLATLTAADFRLGKAYGLGRALADLTLRPTDDDVSPLFHDFARSGRVVTMRGWLRDLKTVLPDHAAEGTLGSLAAWEAWVKSPWVHNKKFNGESETDREAVMDAVQIQGRRWRAVLSGERAAVDLLSAEDYVFAADSLLGRMLSLLKGYAKRFKGVLLGIAAFVLVAVVAIAVRADGTAQGLAVFATIAGGLGVSWKTVNGTLGKVTGVAFPTLWQAELDKAIAQAATVLPEGADGPVPDTRRARMRARLRQLPTGRNAKNRQSDRAPLAQVRR